MAAAAWRNVISWWHHLYIRKGVNVAKSENGKLLYLSLMSASSGSSRNERILSKTLCLSALFIVAAGVNALPWCLWRGISWRRASMRETMKWRLDRRKREENAILCCGLIQMVLCMISQYDDIVIGKAEKAHSNNEITYYSAMKYQCLWKQRRDNTNKLNLSLIF